MRTPTLAVRVRLLLWWKPYLLFNTDIVNSVSNTHKWEAESIVFVNFCSLVFDFLSGALIVRGWVVGASFSCRNFTPSNKHDTFQTFCHVLTRYFYVLFLWTISVSDFPPFKMYKNLGLLLFSITFTVSSHADNHFYNYIYLFQILYSVKSVFLLKCTLRFWPRFLYSNLI